MCVHLRLLLVLFYILTCQGDTISLYLILSKSHRCQKARSERLLRLSTNVVQSTLNNAPCQLLLLKAQMQASVNYLYKTVAWILLELFDFEVRMLDMCWGFWYKQFKRILGKFNTGTALKGLYVLKQAVCGQVERWRSPLKMEIISDLCTSFIKNIQISSEK